MRSPTRWKAPGAAATRADGGTRSTRPTRSSSTSRNDVSGSSPAEGFVRGEHALLVVAQEAEQAVARRRQLRRSVNVRGITRRFSDGRLQRRKQLLFVGAAEHEWT